MVACRIAALDGFPASGGEMTISMARGIPGHTGSCQHDKLLFRGPLYISAFEPGRCARARTSACRR